jgi:hypothetical protein
MDAYFFLLAIDDPYFISTRLNGSILTLPKVHSFIWLAIQNCIPTRSLLFRRGLILQDEA